MTWPVGVCAVWVEDPVTVYYRYVAPASSSEGDSIVPCSDGTWHLPMLLWINQMSDCDDCDDKHIHFVLIYLHF